MDNEKTFTVLRYPNRKLFITGTKAYTNYTEIARRIRSGEKMTAFDRKTNEDVTDYVLSQICVLEISKGERLYDPDILLKSLLTSTVKKRPPLRETI